MTKNRDCPRDHFPFSSKPLLIFLTPELLTRTYSALKYFGRLRRQTLLTVSQIAAHLSMVIFTGKHSQMSASSGWGWTGWEIAMVMSWVPFSAPYWDAFLPISTFWFGGFQFIGKMSIAMPFFQAGACLFPNLHVTNFFFLQRVPSIISPSGKCTLKKGAGQIFQRWRNPRAGTGCLFPQAPQPSCNG